MEPMSKSGMALLICFLVGTSSLFAQKRLEAGVFLDYLNVSQTSTNNFGLGARVGYRVHHHVMLEGELAYDYGFNFGEAYRNIVSGNIAAAAVARELAASSGLRLLTAQKLKVTTPPMGSF